MAQYAQLILLQDKKIDTTVLTDSKLGSQPFRVAA